jgi:PEP-CTERM motif-containing protein
MIGRLGKYAIAWIAAAVMGEAAAALVVTGPAVVARGQEITLSIELSEALGAPADELNLKLDFDTGVLTGIDAGQGALLASALFTPNFATGGATASFSDTLADLGPGVLATWKLKIDPLAHAASITIVTPHLQTFLIDDELTADPEGRPFTIHIVPEPSVNVLLLAGLAALGFAAGARRRR